MAVRPPARRAALALARRVPGRRPGREEWPSMKRKPNKFVLAAVAVVHLVVVTLTWRDISGRPADEIRGNKKFWRIFSALNIGNAALYWLIGRRRS
jgi:hypothetical protein